MTKFIAAALALILAGFAAPAAAQQTWPHPEGLWTLTLGANWRSVPTDPADPDEIAAFEAGDLGPAVRCVVRQKESDLGQRIDQARINTITEGFSPTVQDGELLTDRFVQTIAGVAIVSFTISNTRDITRYRMFSLPVGTRLTFHETSCTGRAPLSPREEDAVAEFLSGILISR